MPDNVNITVNETIENVVINPSISTDVIDFNITSTTEEVTIDVTPNLTTVNINSISGSPVTKTSDLTNDGEDGIHPFITLEDIPPVTGYVPYTGATQDVNLGEFGLQTGNIEFDLTPTNAPTGVGSMFWNDTAGTLDLKLKGGAVTLQIGQETVARVVNKTATNITLLEANYQIVRVTGAQGQRPKVDLALANNDLNSTTTLGLVTETIANNQEGFITTSGQVQQINTTGSLQGETWADGDVLYLSGTIAGQATNIKPIAPIHTVIIGFVEHAHITQGKIFVKVDNSYELEELHNVSAIAPNNNEVLTYDTPTLLWKPKTVISALGYTPFQLPALTSGSVLFSNGTTIAQDNTNFFWDDTNNRLGIGTNAPDYNLDVSGTARFTLAGNKLYGLTLSTDAGGITYLSKIGAAANLMISATRGINIDATNNVGIGITGNSITAGTKLSVWTSGNDTIPALGAWGGKFSVVNAGTNGSYGLLSGVLGSGNAFFQVQRTDGTATAYNLFLQPSGGNILINTTTDNGGKLQIKAPGALSTDIALRVRNSADTGDLMTFDGTGTLGILVSSGGGKIQMQGGSGISNTAGGGLNIGQVFPTGGGGYYIKFWENNNSLNYAKFTLTNICFSDTHITTTEASAQLQVNSTTKGFLPPRMTTTQKNAIATPASGLVVYDTTLGKLCVRGASAWETITSI